MQPRGMLKPPHRRPSKADLDGSGIKRHCNDLRIVQNLGWFRRKSRYEQSNDVPTHPCLDRMMQKAIWAVLLGSPGQFFTQISFDFLRFRGFQDPVAISHRGHSEGVCRWRVASRRGAAR
jgi:hypothetical protein